MTDSYVNEYSTHYEIMNYHLGDFKELENVLSYWDKDIYKLIPRYRYDESKQILYVPAGIDNFVFEDWSGKRVQKMNIDFEYNLKKIYFDMLVGPRDEDQEKAINYLTSQMSFRELKRKTQKVLIMPPGYGKTFCAITAIQKLGYRALIIMHRAKLIEQWKEKFEEYTNMGGPNIVIIDSSKALRKYKKESPSDNNMIFLLTRRLLISYMDKYGLEDLRDLIWKMGIGIKIFDEAHIEYDATLKIDYALNVRHNFYLTATFAQSDYKQNKIFQACYHCVNKLQFKHKGDMRHIIHVVVLYNSYPNALEEHKLTDNKRGVDKYNYIEYQLRKGILEKEVREMLDFFVNKKNMSGKTLVLSSKISTCEYFKDVLESTIEGFNACAIYTNHKVDDYKDYDGISATPGMIGTGEDIPGLRFLFNTVPGSSLTNVEQFSGRLRPYNNGKQNTFYVEFVDMGFPKIYQWYKKRKKLLSKKVKETIEINKTIKK